MYHCNTPSVPNRNTTPRTISTKGPASDLLGRGGGATCTGLATVHLRWRLNLAADDAARFWPARDRWHSIAAFGTWCLTLPQLGYTDHKQEQWPRTMESGPVKTLDQERSSQGEQHHKANITPASNPTICSVRWTDHPLASRDLPRSNCN